MLIIGFPQKIINQFMEEHNEENDDRNFQLIVNFVARIKQQKLNPQILRYQGEAFDELKTLLVQQKQKLKDFMNYEDEYETKQANKNFKYTVYNSEIEKMEYLLKSYLKIRMKKIQLYSFHLMKNEHEAEKLLSSSEYKFLRKYAELRYQYFKDNALKHLIKNYRDFKGIEIIFAKSQEEQRERKIMVETKQSQIELKSPNYNQFVFLMVISNPNQLRYNIDIKTSNVNTENTEVISPGTILYGPFKNVHELLSPDQYRLV